MLCPPGYVCPDGTGLGQAYRTLCPQNYFCPTGTADNYIGSLAGDSINRRFSLQDADPYYDQSHVKYINVNDVRIISAHNKRCFDGTDAELALRYLIKWSTVDEGLNNPFIQYLNSVKPGFLPYQNISVLTGQSNGVYYRPSVFNAQTQENILCARDHKWDLVNQAIYRKECNCVNFIKTVIALYRFWRCTGSYSLENLGLASINPPYKGTRDYWFSRSPQRDHVCVFPELTTPNYVNLTHGAVYHDPTWPAIGVNSSGLLNLAGLQIQTTWTTVTTYQSYDALKTYAQTEFSKEYSDLTKSLQSGGTGRRAMDPYVFDLYWATKLIDEYGMDLEKLVWLTYGTDSYGKKVINRFFVYNRNLTRKIG